MKLVKLAIMPLLLLVLSACGGTEIDKNPAPIVWGGITFTPSTIERSSGKTVWNNVRVSGYGKEATIERVTITGDETVVENLKSDFYSARKQIWKRVTGDYRQALELILSDGNLARTDLPRMNVGFFRGEKESWSYDGASGQSESSQFEDLSLTGIKNYEAVNISVSGQEFPAVKLEKVSLAQIVIPENVKASPEQIVVKGLRLAGISVPQYEASAASFDFSYAGYKLDFALDKAAVPGKILEAFGIVKFPQMLEGSLAGNGEVANGAINAAAQLRLAGLLDLDANIAGRIADHDPDKISFALKDTGLLSYLTEQQKGQLMMLSFMVPNGQTTLLNFLSRPGQTLTGSIDFSGATPDFSFSVK